LTFTVDAAAMNAIIIIIIIMLLGGYRGAGGTGS